jgi:signal transduction histidine kinase
MIGRVGGSLRGRLLAGSATLVMGLSVSFVAVTTLRELRSVERALNSRGEDLAQNLARSGRLGVLAGDQRALEALAIATLGSPGVISVRFTDADGELLAVRAAGISEGGSRRFAAPVVASAPSAEAEEADLDLFGTAEAEEAARARIGDVEVRLDLTDRERSVRQALVYGALLMTIFLLVGLVAARILADRVLRPLGELSRGVRLVSEGELGHRLAADGPAEVADLAHAYNDMAAALEVRTEELRRQTRDLEEFVYIASHDLQSPLISIQGFSERLGGGRGPEMSEDQARWLARIRANVDQMGALIRGILDLSRLNTRHNDPSRASARDLVDQALEGLVDAIEERGITLDVQDGEWPQLEGDLPRLRSIFGNLVDNAIKYIGPDNPAPRIEIGWAPAEGGAEFRVRDNGVGIAQEQHDRVFRPLERLKAVDAHGIGMGLSLVRKIVEGHGGTVALESAPGEGATFTFTLPIVEGEPGRAA